MMLNPQHLGEAIRKSGKTKSFLAEQIGISKQNFSNKVTGRTPFNAVEFVALMNELGITLPEEVQYLFEE